MQYYRYRKTWTLEEDLVLKELVGLYKGKNWKKIADEISKRINKVRTGKQCRERWDNKLKPNIELNDWTDEEIKRLFEIQEKIGNKWSKISPFFPKRSKNSIKNFFYSTIRRNIRRFNKDKREDEKIKGDVKELIKIPEIREILICEKSCEKHVLRSKQLSDESFWNMKMINDGLLDYQNNGSEEDFGFLEMDEYREYAENEDENILPLIDQAILWE
ncbi:hypothetical protein SteCoe_28229 [Stentor coeruleus]|uniref:Myb-like DNA-binding domain containing protein n=1 Tax=Stentor coeruleus TaxID=5963 RepID=A0A1R2B8Q5_9CILI|nr:hypothetical protein SteCoe_28229 [Stentor coeruleus]